ncbi:hypothetical protein MTO96_014802 [Rhipicephalus appendiculatus]
MTRRVRKNREMRSCLARAYGRQRRRSYSKAVKPARGVEMEPYERMSMVVSNREDSLASSTAEVVERVQSGDYAFLMGAAAMEYLTDRDCQLAHIVGALGSKGY